MGFFKELKKELLEFCSTTSIQGLSNVTDTKHGCLSQILWAIIVIIFFVFSGIGIKESVDGEESFWSGVMHPFDAGAFFFLKCWPSSSMIYISVIITHITNYIFFIYTSPVSL